VARDEPRVIVGGLLEQAILGKSMVINEVVRKWTKKGVHTEKQVKEAPKNQESQRKE